MQEDELSFQECIKIIYDDIARSFPSHVGLLATIVTEPLSTAQDFLETVFVSLNPSIEAFIKSSWNKAASSAETQDFLAALLEVKNSQEVLSQVLEKETQNRTNRKVLEFVCQPLENYLSYSYSDLEQTIISEEFAKIIVDGRDKVKSLHVLSHAANRISSAFYNSLLRCLQLTNGRAIKDVCQLFEKAIKEHMDSLSIFARGATSNFKPEQCLNFLDPDDAGFEALSDAVKALHYCGATY